MKDPRGGGQARTESLIRFDFEQMLGNLKLERSSEQRVLSVSSRLNMYLHNLYYFEEEYGKNINNKLDFFL